MEMRDFDVSNKENGDRVWSMNEEKNELMGMIKWKDLEIQ